MNLPFLHPGAVALERHAFDAAEPALRRRVSAHLLRCHRCQREVQTMRRVATTAAVPLRQPPPEVLARVLAGRAAGERIILPAGTPAPPARPRVVAAGAVAAAVALLILAVIPRPTPPGSSGELASSALGPGFLVSEATAEVVAGENAPPVTGVDGRKLRAGVWRYAERRSDRAGRTTGRDTLVLRVSAGREGSRDAWRIASLRTAQSETLVVDRRTLAPLSRALHVADDGRFDRLDVTQRFSGNRLTGRVAATANGRTRIETLVRNLAADAPPRLSDAIAPLYLGAVPVDARWSGRIAMVGWGVQAKDVLLPVTLRVSGAERVRTPAGAFSCWRLDVRAGGQVQTCWVRQADGVAVRTRRATMGGITEWVLFQE